MLSSFSSTLALVSAFVGLAAAADCPTSEYGRCGLTPAGVSCCPTNFYCQPWDYAHYQCMPVPPKCPNPQSNINFDGTNLTTVDNIRSSEECCDQCAAASGCVGYTFINDNPGNPACYLKSAITTSLSFTGAVSGFLNASLTTAIESVAVANTSSSSSAAVDVGNSTSSNSSDVSVDSTTSSASGSSVDLGNSTSSDSSGVVAGEADSLDEGSWDPLNASMSDDTSVDQ